MRTPGTINTVMEAAKGRSAVQAPLVGGKQGQYSNDPMLSHWSYEKMIHDREKEKEIKNSFQKNVDNWVNDLFGEDVVKRCAG